MIPTTRITDANAIGVKSVMVEYSSVCPFNSDNTRLLLQQSDGFIRLHDGDGGFIKILKGLLPSSEARWARDNPHVLYIVSGNQFIRYDTVFGGITVLHTFPEYSMVSGLGESDISEDGRHMVLCGDRREVFVYEIPADNKWPAFPATPGLNGLYITPDNNVLCGGTTGAFLYDKNGTQLRQVAKTQSHMDVMRDTNGDEVLIRINAADNPHLEGCANGIEKVRLADGQATCLWPIGWGLSVHISCPDRGPALVSTYTSTLLRPSQVVNVPLDGSAREVLCDTGASASREAAQPKASVSRDGSRFLYRSDKDGAVDVWMGKLEVAAPIPAPLPTTEPEPPLTPAGETGIDMSQWGELDEGEELLCHLKVVAGKFQVVKVYSKL